MYWTGRNRAQYKTFGLNCKEAIAHAAATILVVDDDPDFVEIMRTSWKPTAIRSSRRNGDQALAQVKAHRPT